jgi:hypothetical protein
MEVISANKYLRRELQTLLLFAPLRGHVAVGAKKGVQQMRIGKRENRKMYCRATR